VSQRRAKVTGRSANPAVTQTASCVSRGACSASASRQDVSGGRGSLGRRPFTPAWPRARNRHHFRDLLPALRAAHSGRERDQRHGPSGGPRERLRLDVPGRSTRVGSSASAMIAAQHGNAQVPHRLSTAHALPDRLKWRIQTRPRKDGKSDAGWHSRLAGALLENNTVQGSACQCWF
jgi:hypothetical protein